MIFWLAVVVGLISLITAVLDVTGNSQWAPVGFILALLCLWIAWMTK